MRLDGDVVVIDNRIIVEFLRSNERYARDVEYLIETTCRMMMNGDRDTLGENIFERMSAMGKSIEDVKGCIVENECLKAEIQRMTETLMDVVKVSDEEKVKGLMASVAEEMKEKLGMYWENVSMLQKINNDRLVQIDEKVNSISITRSATKKGQDGERDIIELLSDKLPSRNGYNVESVRGVANYCDIIVKCEGYENIHIDVKNYESGGKIRTSVVEKFRSDLIGLNVSGIMVSLWSGIVSKGAIEIEQLPTGKFAVYISNTGMNVDYVVEFIYLLHKLEKFGSKDGVMMSSDMVNKIRNIVTDTVRRMNDIKTHLTASISALHEINLNMITNLLMNPDVKELEKVPVDKICPTCKKEFSSRQKCRDHIANNTCQKLVEVKLG